MTEPARHPGAQPGGRLFWTGVAVGWGIIGYGVVGALGIAEDTHPRSLAIWLVACLIAHDLVAAPIVFFAGRALRRLAPRRMRAALAAALYVSAVLVLISIPVIGRFGARRDNPTLLPRDATAGLIAALAIVWVASAAIIAAGWWLERSRRRAS